ncbi:MAG: glycosyltransferase family 4 protein [Planctomycetes bacterium]|nr:glycosyltransferase family 4 protein [Planctomycetota bacterium]
MKALWLVRADLEAHPGGDTVQILRTAEALRARGHEVRLDGSPRPRLASCDLVHLFHLDRLWENGPHARRLASSGVPAVLSTIWWPTTEFDAAGRTGVQGLVARAFGAELYPTLKVAQRSLLAWPRAGLAWSHRPVLGFEPGVRRLLARCAALLPNSEAEAQALATRFGALPPVVVVPNAADAAFFTLGPEAERSGVVCVGRVEPRKNQLALVEALRDEDVELTFVGAPGRYAGDYLARCRAAAGPRTRFLGPRDAAGVRDVLRAAAVHACPSWYERRPASRASRPRCAAAASS